MTQTIVTPPPEYKTACGGKLKDPRSYPSAMHRGEMEFLVGVILFALGIQILRMYLPKKKHLHIHNHGDKMHVHEHVHHRKGGEEDIQHHPQRQHRSLLLVTALSRDKDDAMMPVK